MHIILLITMLFCHIVDDYYLQGWFVLGKQKNWWKQKISEDVSLRWDLYKNDYLMALFEHAFSWSCMICFPIIVHMIINENIISAFLIISIVINTIIHALVDNEKANKFRINLIQDQLIHIVQVVVTWSVYCGGVV